jgi:hypothetical protein
MVLLGLILLNPILLNIVLRWRHGAFWDRYAGYAAAAVLLVFCVRTDVWKTSSTPIVKDASALADVRSDLSLVDAGGVTFFEMNHHEKPDILSRLYFLKDRSLAMSYTHTNIFEDHGWGDGMKPDYPISASVRSYTDFIHQHREFLVLGAYDAPEEWVLRKLHDDGARLTWLGAYPLPYVDYNLYLVTLAAAK